MIYNDEFAYIHVPRTAGLSLKYAIKEKYNDAVSLPEQSDFPNPLRMYQPYWYWEEIVPDLKNRWVFSTVRDPYKRAISLWKYATQDRPEFSNFLKGISFKNFWDVNVNQLAPTLRFNVRSTQCEHLSSVEGDLVPNIFRMEDQLNKIEQKLNIKIEQKLNVSKSYNYKTYYNKETVDLINDIFEEDFVQFGYTRRTYDKL